MREKIYCADVKKEKAKQAKVLAIENSLPREKKPYPYRINHHSVWAEANVEKTKELTKDQKQMLPFRSFPRLTEN
jgi:hypothetical protein